MKSKNRSSLSVVYATYNEAANIARSLESIQSIADEIIIVDGSSTDNTADIAKDFGARVVKTTNKPIFHINKQMAMDEARGVWTLQMDADEVIDDEMRADIIRLLNSEVEDTSEAYWLRRKNWFLGRFLTKGGQYPDPVIRFYQTGKARLPMKTVHEQMEVDGTVGWLKGHLLHYSSPTFLDYLRKLNTYTSLAADEMFEKKIPLTFWSFLYHAVWKSKITFLQLYYRHKGFIDGFPGFVFAWCSGLHHFISYVKYWEKVRAKKS